MLNPASSLASLWLIVLRLVELHGIDPRQFRQEVGVPAETLRDVNARLPSRLVDIAFAKAAALIPDPAFALRAGECWHPSNLGTMGYAWLSSRTLHTALKRLERFGCILSNRATYRCVDKPAGVHFVLEHGRGDTPIGHAIADSTLSLLLSMCRTNFGSKLNAAALCLRRQAPADPQPWRQLFGCDVQFGALDDSLLLDRDTVDTPLPSANVPLANTFDRILTEQLANFFDDDIVSRGKAHLLRQLTSGVPSAQETATALGMSQRTLQRKLQELGLTYQGLCDETRHELARRYLDDTRKSVTEVTFLLGFSEQSAFTRAFRRWSGMSPTTYRHNPSA